MYNVRRLMLTRHPILRAIYDVCQAIEACGASPALTHAVTLAGQLSEQAATILDERDAASNDQPGGTAANATLHAQPDHAGTASPPDPTAAPAQDMWTRPFNHAVPPFAAPAQGELQTEYQAGWDNCYAMAEPAISALRDERDDWKRKYGDANEWGLRNTAAWKDRAERAEAECADLRRRLDEHIDDKERALRLSAKESTRLTTEVERLRADAERYRLLRDRMAHHDR